MSTQLLPAALARAKSSQFLTIFLPAGGKENIKATGSRFYVKESSGLIRAKLDQGAAADYSQGCGITLPGEAFFENIELNNPGTADLTVKVYVGFGDYIDQRAEMIEPPSAIRSLFAGNLAPGGSVAVPASTGSKMIRRKAVLVTNNSDELRLTLRDSSGAAVGTIFTAQCQAFPVSGPCSVHNPHGMAVDCIVSVIVWETE